jgi:hypothetical protein
MGGPAAVPAHHGFATIKNILTVVIAVHAVNANGQECSVVLQEYKRDRSFLGAISHAGIFTTQHALPDGLNEVLFIRLVLYPAVQLIFPDKKNVRLGVVVFGLRCHGRFLCMR